MASYPPTSNASFFTSCAQVLSLAQANKDDLAALLDPATGFAPQLQQLCRDQYASLAMKAK
jgi:nuclear pore complex protein Nup107